MTMTATKGTLYERRAKAVVRDYNQRGAKAARTYTRTEILSILKRNKLAKAGATTGSLFGGTGYDLLAEKINTVTSRTARRVTGGITISR
jgi:hypothetical protein